MSDKRRTPYEADELTQYIDQRRAALATPSPSRSVEPVGPPEDRLPYAPVEGMTDALLANFPPGPRVLIRQDAYALLASLATSGHILVEREAWDRLCAVEAAARAVLTELDIIRDHREQSGVGYLVVHVDTHRDLAVALRESQS